LDYLFSRLHSAICNDINCSVFIDTPLDVAMARRILRDFQGRSTEDIFNDLNNYLSRGRQAYLGMLVREKTDCDIIIDGTLSLESIVNDLYERIRRDSE